MRRILCLIPVPHLGGNTDWQSAAETLSSIDFPFLSDTVLPDLERHVVTSKIMTPLDFRDRLSAPFGAAFGWRRVDASAWFRPHNERGDSGLYLVGAGPIRVQASRGLSSARVLIRSARCRIIKR